MPTIGCLKGAPTGPKRCQPQGASRGGPRGSWGAQGSPEWSAGEPNLEPKVEPRATPRLALAGPLSGRMAFCSRYRMMISCGFSNNRPTKSVQMAFWPARKLANRVGGVSNFDVLSSGRAKGAMHPVSAFCEGAICGAHCHTIGMHGRRAPCSQRVSCASQGCGRW